MIKLIDFKSDHAQRMVWSLNSSEVEIDEKYHKLLDTLEVPDMSFTATHDNKIICAGGIIPIWDNVYEGWMMGSSLIWNFRIVSAKIIKKSLEKFIKEKKNGRINY